MKFTKPEELELKPHRDYLCLYADPVSSGSFRVYLTEVLRFYPEKSEYREGFWFCEITEEEMERPDLVWEIELPEGYRWVGDKNEITGVFVNELEAD